MSELTTCNYDSFGSKKLSAEKEGKSIEVKDEDGGKAVYLDGKWVSWYMELTESCCC